MKKPESELQELVSRLQRALGDALVSVVVYGSAARDDFHENFSDVNLLVVVRELTLTALPGMSDVLRWWSRELKLRPPLIMTRQELEESADVFAIELLDIQSVHRTLSGADIVAAIKVPMNLHRVQVEHELRTTLLRLRHHLLLAADNAEELRAVLAKSVTSVLTLLRHALVATGHGTAQDHSNVLLKAHEVFGIDTAPVQSVLDLRKSGSQPSDLRGLYHAYMSAIQTVAHELDVRAPKRHVQRVS
jgi:predicted nucleotidyltransferase